MATTSITKSKTNPFMSSSAMDVLLASQFKNVEAFTMAQQMAFERVHGMQRKQIAMACEAADKFSAIFFDLVGADGSLEDRFAKQAERSTEAVTYMLNNACELSELATQAATDGLSVLSKRMKESLEEIRDFPVNGSAGPASN